MLKIYERIEFSAYKKHLADCVIKTHDDRILIQKRPNNWHGNAGGLNLFGGHVEPGESIVQGLVRELKEETGANVSEQDLEFIGIVTEDFTNHTEAVHVYFWHDRQATITGCYEAEPAMFDKTDDILKEDKLMEYAAWALKQCHEKGLIP